MTEPQTTRPSATAPLDVVTRILHLGLAVFGVWAWLIGSGWIGAGAADYERDARAPALGRRGRAFAPAFAHPRPPHPRRLFRAGEALGLLVFVWLGLSGLSNAITITPGVKLTAVWPHFIKHWRQIGNVLVPAYLVLHMGGTVAHSVVGKQIVRSCGLRLGGAGT